MVERYNVDVEKNENGYWEGILTISHMGEWVRYSDYAALAAGDYAGLVERLREDAEYMDGYADFVGSNARIVRNITDAAGAITALTARIAALEAENKRLRKALEPFAKAGELFPGEAAEYDQYIYAPAAGNEYALTGNHLRTARGALEGEK